MLDISQKTTIGKVYSAIVQNKMIQPGDRIVVAVSGGADSICLLTILLELKDKLGISLSVAHFNHRLRGVESDKDEKFVADFCKERGVHCHLGRANKAGELKSEEKAREARYKFFLSLVGEYADTIALAHNQNDQAETVLLRLVRGSGFRGLRAIPPTRKNFIRPLLTISRSEIEHFLEARHLTFRTDASNSDPVFVRNKIRAQILPQLAEINPNIIETLANSARVIGLDYEFLENIAATSLQKLISSQTEHSLELKYKDWLLLHPALKRLTLRLAVSELVNLADVTVKQIEETVTMLEKGYGKKFKLLPHSLRIALESDKIKIDRVIKE